MKTEKTWIDPIVEEIRDIRRELVRDAGGDLQSLGNWLIQTQQRHGEKLVKLSRDQPRDK